MAKNIKGVEDLQPDRTNANKGTERGRYMVEASLREVGAGRSIVADKNGQVIAGNKTLEAWTDIGGEIEIVRTDGKKLVVVQREDLDLSDDTGAARKLAYYDNRAGEVGLEWDTEQLLADINAGLDLTAMFRQEELDELLDGLQEKEPVEDVPPQVDRAEELRQKWQVETGQLWQLGDHRLICGDCTDAAVVARGMSGDKADMIQTDPPYGVDYSGQNQTMFYGNGTSGKARQRIDGDSTLHQAMSLTEAALLALGAPILFLWHAPQFHVEARNAISSSGYEVFAVIVWNKNHANFGAMGATYKPKFEMALACKHDKIPWFGPDNEVTVWDIDRASANEFHPTQKPQELFGRAIRNHTQPRAVVYDPFSGSGTTIIACEQLGRRCRAVEISPGYVAVALERFYSATGKTPVLVQ